MSVRSLLIIASFRFTSSEDSDIPLSINCWPSDNGSGGCDVNIEYELENTDLELQVCVKVYEEYRHLLSF